MVVSVYHLQGIQVEIKVLCAGVNPVETYIRSGTHNIKPKLPYIPGTDGSGVVSQISHEKSKYKVS